MAKEDRGFANMDRAKQREIASKGAAHEWTSEEAREAGRKGGMASHRRRKGLAGVSDIGSGANTPMDHPFGGSEDEHNSLR